MTAAAQIGEQGPFIQIIDADPSSEEARTVREIFDSFLSLLSLVPRWTNLLREVRAYEKFSRVKVIFKNNTKLRAETYINKGDSHTISLGTSELPENWTLEKKRHSRLTNRGFLGHELGHTYITTRWEVRRSGIKIELPKRGEEAALEEHFCDVMAIACRHLSPNRGGEHPWAILHFEEEDEGGGAAAMDHPPFLEEERFLRAFNIRLLRRDEKGNYYDPHKMSDWPPIQKLKGKNYDFGGIHIRCCILNKVFYDFFTYLQPDPAARITAEASIISPHGACLNPLHVWTNSMEDCIQAIDFKFKTFAEYTLTKITPEYFPQNHERVHAELKRLWIESEVLKDSLFARAKEKAKKIFQSGGAHRRLEEL